MGISKEGLILFFEKLRKGHPEPSALSGILGWPVGNSELMKKSI